MNWTLIGIIVLVIVILVGPFAALRAASHLRSRRPSAPPRRPPDDEES